MRALLPRARRVGLVGDPSDPRFDIDRSALAPLLAAAGMSLMAVPVHNPPSLESGLLQLVNQRVEVIFTTSAIMFNLASLEFRVGNLASC